MAFSARPELSRYRGTLLGVAVGDALGAPFEGGFGVALEAIDSLRADPGELRYTDDTHMTIGVAQSLIACRGFDGAHMARVCAENFRAEPWRGYGPGPPRVFGSVLRGARWDEPARQLFGGTGSLGNGAAMRVAPAALFAASDFELVAQLARQTARLTHAHKLGIEGAVMQACAVALSLESDTGARLSPSHFLDSLRRYVRAEPFLAALEKIEQIYSDATPDAVAAGIGNDITALAAVPASLCCFLRHPDSFADAVLFAIAVGGDTDTIAAMTGALSGARLGEAGIPSLWRTRVESAEMLEMLADKLWFLARDRESSR
jgi:poly(ADP-ribose) glycohydrolase ARH3